MLLVYGGLPWMVPVLFFFATSSILSKIDPSTSRDAEHGEDVRDAWQVLSNGGVAWVLFGFALLTQEQSLFFAGYVGAMAAATADTWGTELGRLSKGVARSIRTGKIVMTGESGGMSWQGTLGGALGAALIGGLAWYFSPIATPELLLVITCAGVVGSLADSLLGATLQARYKRDGSDELSEYADEQSYLYSGVTWVTNNVVNFSCTLIGAAVAMALYQAF